jgi:hypothetical protein
VRTSRKKLLRLEKKNRQSHEEFDYCEEDRAYCQGRRSEDRRKPRYSQSSDEVFKCRHCRRFVCPLPSGGHHRNHCPFCLYSRHVDDRQSGDRMSTCGASMEPIGYFQRPNEEYVIIHRCCGCDFERFNRVAADDDFELVLSLPELAPRSSREIKAQRLQSEVGETAELDTDQIA